MNYLSISFLVGGILFGFLFGKSMYSQDPPSSGFPKSGYENPTASLSPETSSSGASDSGTSLALELYNSISRCRAEDCLRMAGEILALPADSPHRLAALDLLMEQWVEIDFAAALDHANALRGDDRTQAFRSSLLRLGNGRFEETLAWMNANLPVASCQESQVWLFCGLADSNPTEALAAINRLNPGGLKEDALFSVVSRWAETDINGAFEWFKTAPWTGKSMELYNRLMTTYITKFPDEARTFVAQLDDAEYWKGRYGQQLVNAFATTDPVKALEVTLGLSNPRVRDNAFTDLFEQWSATDPTAAFGRALVMANDESLSPLTRNTISRQAAFAMLLENRGVVLQNFDRLPADIRDELAGPIVTQWMAEDPSAAMAWAVSFDRESPASNLALCAAAAHQEKWDPETAITTAGRIAYPDIRQSSIHSALQNLYRQDPERATIVAADANRVHPEIQSLFQRWVKESGSDEMTFLSREAP